jgi:hypothetical protein
MGRCLFGIGTGQVEEVLIVSRLRTGVRGTGEEGRWGGMGRGKAMVAIVEMRCGFQVVLVVRQVSGELVRAMPVRSSVHGCNADQELGPT